jgi:hypothetical protein
MKIVADEVVERVKIDACKNDICGREILPQYARLDLIYLCIVSG